MTVIITLLVIGAVLLFLEVFLPGMIAGIAGCVCIIAAVGMSYSQFGFPTGNYVLGGVLIASVAGIVCWLKYFPDSRMARRFVAQNAVGDIGTDRPELVGATGETLSQLRPCGMAVINGKRVDVVTEGTLVEKGHAHPRRSRRGSARGRAPHRVTAAAQSLLHRLYGADIADQCAPRIETLLASVRCNATTFSRFNAPAPLTQRDALLLTYADQVRASGETPLRTLAEFCDAHLRDTVSGVHILPFYPWTSDDGFR
jgi:membrane protein implicated in regulation of membrane protease activity